jgi:hypothetical protein
MHDRMHRPAFEIGARTFRRAPGCTGHQLPGVCGAGTVSRHKEHRRACRRTASGRAALGIGDIAGFFRETGELGIGNFMRQHAETLHVQGHLGGFFGIDRTRAHPELAGRDINEGTDPAFLHAAGSGGPLRLRSFRCLGAASS